MVSFSETQYRDSASSEFGHSSSSTTQRCRAPSATVSVLNGIAFIVHKLLYAEGGKDYEIESS